MTVSQPTAFPGRRQTSTAPTDAQVKPHDNPTIAGWPNPKAPETGTDDARPDDGRADRTDDGQNEARHREGLRHGHRDGPRSQTLAFVGWNVWSTTPRTSAWTRSMSTSARSRAVSAWTVRVAS